MSLYNRTANILQSKLIKNSAWGIASNILQTVFLSLFFILVARKYNPTEFGEFLISTTVYQLVAAFSSLGLGQWFIRKYSSEQDKQELTNKFLKTQAGLGLLFYLLNIALAFVLYPSGQIRLLCVILGTNIIFDNLINALRSLNIAEFKQNKTAIILIGDGFLKLLVGCLLFINPFSTTILSVFMIVVRVVTLGIFIRIGSSSNISIAKLWRLQLSLNDIKELIMKNWQFMIIGSISIVYWRVANIIISKTLTLADVSDYEISFRVFSIAQILPVIAAATIFPQFIKFFNEKSFEKLKRFYKSIFLLYSFFALVAYAFIYSFADVIILTAFGPGYPGSILCLKQMFLTFLVLPTVLLQANLIVSIGLEKLDMWFNIASLLINVTCCFVGLYFIKSLTVVNYSIFISFLVFHFSQDILLIRKKLANVTEVIAFYCGLGLFLLVYQYMSGQFGPTTLFLSFTTFLIVVSIAVVFTFKARLNFLADTKIFSHE